MKRLLESYIKEVLSEKKIALKEKPCECAEGESCDECGPSEVDEMSTLGGGAITGVIPPLGAGPKGKVRYADPNTKDSPIEGPSKHLRKSNKNSKKKRKTKK